MVSRKTVILAAVLLCAGLVLSCSKEKKEEAKPETEEGVQTLSYVNEDVNFGIYFDEDATERTITLAEGQEEVKAYLVIKFPEEVEISAAEFRLRMPEGVTVESDKFHPGRAMMLGTFEHGISESFRCVRGPRLVLHVLTLKVDAGVENAELALLPGEQSEFIGVAECKEGHPLIRGAAFKAVINPAD